MITIDYTHFNSFNLTDPKTGKTKNLTDDFGGIIINTNEEVYERECMPQINSITAKNDFMDGEIFLDSHYGTRVIDVTCLFSEENGGADLFELKKWIGKKYQQIFNWDDDLEDKAIYAIGNGDFKSQVYYGKKFFGKIDLKFVCHSPYYFLLKDRDVKVNQGNSLVINTNYIVKSKGNCDSYPLIKIIPSTTTISFKWNDLTITLSNLTINNPIYLDCGKSRCYEMSNNIKVFTINKYSSNYTYDFPKILCDNTNNIKLLSGGINSMTITPNTKII